MASSTKAACFLGKLGPLVNLFMLLAATFALIAHKSSAESCSECDLPDSSALSFCKDIPYSVCRSNMTWKEMDDYALNAYTALGITVNSTANETLLKEVNACGWQLKKVVCAKAFPACELSTPLLYCEKDCKQDVCTRIGEERTKTLCKPYSGEVMRGTTSGSKCFSLDYSGPNKFAWILGFGISVVFSFLASVGINLQKKALKNNELIASQMKEAPLPVYKLPLWVVGFFLILLGSILDFVAFGLAPQSLLAPLGALTLVWNMILAPCFNKEKLTRSDILSTMVIFVGATLAVAFGSHSTPEYDLEDLILLYGDSTTIQYFVAIPILLLAHYGVLSLIAKYDLTTRRGQKYNFLTPTIWSRLELLAYSGLAGTMGGQSVLFAKSVAELVKSSIRGKDAFMHVETYIFVVALSICLMVQIHYLNGALLRYDALSVVPVYQAYWIVMGVLGGVIYFQEIHHFSPTQQAFFTVGILVTITGVGLLTRRKIHPQIAIVEGESKEGAVGVEGAPGAVATGTQKAAFTKIQQVDTESPSLPVSVPGSTVSTLKTGEGSGSSSSLQTGATPAVSSAMPTPTSTTAVSQQVADNFFDMSPRIAIGEIFEGLGLPKERQPELFRRESVRRDSTRSLRAQELVEEFEKQEAGTAKLRTSSTSSAKDSPIASQQGSSSSAASPVAATSTPVSATGTRDQKSSSARKGEDSSRAAL